ncbi:retrovirus-related Pol polyprotein from transposon opus [Nephila pilipes]|uniref:RNA-directed DNA polymerase n=1 Tax=Nephila pilipes TaxID=299642 RepID=A0A8X6TY11_NEPPI|nr:retrovirus-related Pol polyprotein from transposon opus [Nephila pilipes]
MASSAAEEVLVLKSRLFLRNGKTGCKFLVDRGADVSIIPFSKASSSEKEHQDHIKLVYDRYQQFGLRINVAKSVMGADRGEHLEHLITAEGSCPLPEKIEAINNYKMSDTIHELRTFLGIINFYRRYLKNAAKTQVPLHDLLKGTKKKDQRKVPWTEGTIKSFEQCKSDLTKAALLSFPKFGLPLCLCADASDFVIGSVLQQIEAVNEINYDAVAEEPYIPQKFRLQLFQLIHGFAHPGVKSTIKLMTEKCVWPNIKKQIREWAKARSRCQKCKVIRHTKSKFDEYQPPDERFRVVLIDLIGPLPPLAGMMYSVASIHRFSCWIEVVPLPDITAEIVEKALYEH